MRRLSTLSGIQEQYQMPTFHTPLPHTRLLNISRHLERRLHTRLGHLSKIQWTFLQGGPCATRIDFLHSLTMTPLGHPKVDTVGADIMSLH